MKAEQSGPVVPSAVEGFIAAGKDGRAADAILDRDVHNAYRIELAGESLRKRRSQSCGRRLRHGRVARPAARATCNFRPAVRSASTYRVFCSA